MRHVFTAAAAVVLAASATLPAQASSFLFNFDGGGVSGSIALTYEVNQHTGILPGTSPNPVDPIGSFIVTGATGTFSDANIGLTTTINGVVPSHPANPEPGNLQAPASFGFYSITNSPPGLSYDNLFYPGGSPLASTDYPFSGGFFDIYGLMLTTTDNLVVNFWSNGDVPPDGVNYGAAVTDGTDVLSYVAPITLSAVPEPASWALMIFGFCAAGAIMRRRAVLVRA